MNFHRNLSDHADFFFAVMDNLQTYDLLRSHNYREEDLDLIEDTYVETECILCAPCPIPGIALA